MKMRDRACVASVLAATAVSVASACGACTGSGETPGPLVGPDAGPPESGDDTGASSDTAHDGPLDGAEEAGWDSAGPDGCSPFDPPPSVPVGWQRWTGWSCECPLYVPGSTGQMPDPIEWEPCTVAVSPSLDCRQMKHFWNETGFAVSLFPKMSLDPASGAVLLGFTRYAFNGDPNTRYVLVAEADGPVRSAFLQVNPRYKGCEFTNDSNADGRYVLRGIGDTWDGSLESDSVVEGAIAGRVGDALPTAVMKYQAEPGAHASWAVSRDWIVQRKWDYIAWSWDLKTQHKVWPDAADPDHLPGANVIGVGEDLMVEVGDLQPVGVMTWNETQGLRPLIRWFGDCSRSAGNFGTDGKNMVWTYVEGEYHNGGTYDTMSVMTAPYSTDAAQVAATTRRLRSDVKGFEPDNWAVGCGYAARCPGLGDPLGNAMFVVRLSDGVSWTLPWHGSDPNLSWDNALGITCEELFATVEVPGTVRILRIRLDSLGPGTPPD